jgi:MoxR-like ATPase
MVDTERLAASASNGAAPPGFASSWRDGSEDAAPVGRAAEPAELGAILDAVRSGEPRMVLIQGAAGIGKSALVHRFVKEATDARVLRAIASRALAVLQDPPPEGECASHGFGDSGGRR